MRKPFNRTRLVRLKTAILRDLYNRACARGRYRIADVIYDELDKRSWEDEMMREWTEQDQMSAASERLHNLRMEY
jgi:hypothetical protein